MLSTVLLALSGARALAMMIGLSLLSWWPLLLVVGGVALWAWGLHATRRAAEAPEPAPAREPVPVPVQRRPFTVPRQRGAGSRSRNIASGSVNPNPR